MVNQTGLFDEPLLDWTKYRIKCAFGVVEAWFMGGIFITANYCQINLSDCESYTKIATAAEMWG